MGSNPATPTDCHDNHARHAGPPVRVTEEHQHVKSTVENLSPTRVRLAVEVPFDDLKPSLDSAYKAIAQQIRVPGFRPGKVPARVIDQRVGRGAVLQEAVNDALPRLYGEAAREHELQPLGQPEIIDITQRRRDHRRHRLAASPPRSTSGPRSPCRTSTASPSRSTTPRSPTPTSTSSSTSCATGSAPSRASSGPPRTATTSPSTSSTAVDGEEIEGGSAKGLSYVVGSGDLVDGLDDAITGKSAGESATFTTTLRQGEHAGDEAEVTATVKSVKVKELPEVDDEFAQLASEFDTVDELRADLRERLGRVRVLEQGAQARDKLLEHLIDTVEFPLPESAVTAEVEYRQHDIIHSLGHDDALFEQVPRVAGQDPRGVGHRAARERGEVGAGPVHPRRDRRAGRTCRSATPSSPSTSSGRPRSTRCRRRSSPTRSSRPATCRCSSPTCGATRRWPTLLESATITDASGNAVDLAALDESEDGAAEGDDDSGRRHLDDDPEAKAEATDDADGPSVTP